jgi:hypothetical protein
MKPIMWYVVQCLVQLAIVAGLSLALAIGLASIVKAVS